MNTPLPFDQDDLSSPARLRLAALELYAERGVEMASVREIAQRAGVAPGLVRHHFGSKAGLTRAVDDDVLRLIAATLDEVPLVGTPQVVSAARDALAEVAGHVVTLADAEDLPGHGAAVNVRFDRP